MAEIPQEKMLKTVLNGRPYRRRVSLGEDLEVCLRTPTREEITCIISYLCELKKEGYPDEFLEMLARRLRMAACVEWIRLGDRQQTLQPLQHYILNGTLSEAGRSLELEDSALYNLLDAIVEDFRKEVCTLCSMLLERAVDLETFARLTMQRLQNNG